MNAATLTALSSRHGRSVQYFDGSSRFGGPSNGANVLLADGSVRFLTKDVDPEVLKQLVNRRDGMPVEVP